MGKSAPYSADKLKDLSKDERKVLFAFRAFPSKFIGADNWYDLMGANFPRQNFSKALKNLCQKNIITRSVSDSGQDIYRASNNEDIPNFFVAEIPDLSSGENEKFITLKPCGGVEDLNIRFVMRTKDFHKYAFMPGKKGLFRFQDLQLSQEELGFIGASSQKTICVEPSFAFSAKREATHVIALAQRSKSNQIRLLGDMYKGVLFSGAAHASLKCDSIYRFKISSTYSPFSPRLELAQMQEVYNPHSHVKNLASSLAKFDIPGQHKRRVIDEAKRVQATAGPFITPKANDNKFIISIDDAGTKCIDDAFSLERHSGGYTQETYLIAVPLIFDMESPLYEASLNVGQTLYAGKRTVCPTIPTMLSHGHASLHAGQDCPVLVVRSEYNLDGRLVDLDFKQIFRSDVIRVNKNITPQDFKKAIAAGDSRYTVYQDFMDARRNMAQQASATPLRSIFNACSETGVIDSNIVADRMIHANATAGKWFAEKGLYAGYRNMGISTSAAHYDFMRYNLGKISAPFAQILPVRGQDCTAEDIGTLLVEADKVGQKDKVAAIIHDTKLNFSQYGAMNKGHIDIGVSAYATVSSSARRHIDYINQARLFLELGIDIKGADKLYDQSYVQDVCDHLNDVQLRHSVLFQNSQQQRSYAIMKELSESIEPVRVAEITGKSVLLRYENFDVSTYFNEKSLNELGIEIDGGRQELVMPSYFTGQSEKRFTYGDVMYLHMNKDYPTSGTSPFFGFKTMS